MFFLTKDILYHVFLFGSVKTNVEMMRVCKSLPERTNFLVILITRSITPAQARSCGPSFCFISIFARVIVVVNFAFCVNHCFSSF